MKLLFKILIFSFLGILPSVDFANETVMDRLDQPVVGFDFSVVSSGNFIVCNEDRMNIQLHFEVVNNELDSASGLVVDWFLSEDVFGSTSISDIIGPSSSFVVFLPSFSVPNVGNYSVQINVSSVSQSSSFVLNFNVLPPLVVDDLQDTMVCEGSLVPLQLNSNYSSYAWSTGNITSSISVSNQGLYYVNVTDSLGCHGSDSLVISNFDAPQNILGNDTVICEGDILVSSATTSFDLYNWSTGSDSSSIFISQAGSYYLYVEDSLGCIYVDTIEVQTTTVPVSGIPNYTEICEGETLILGANPGYVSYSWNTGATTSSIPINTNGVYVVSVVGSNGCIGVDTVSVSIRPLPAIVFNDSVMCNLESFELKLGEAFPSFQWSTGDTSSSVYVTQPGWYHVTVTDELGCISEDSVKVLDVQVSVDLGEDDTVCVGSSFALFPQGKFDSYLWSDGSNGQTKVVTTSGNYSVTVSKNGCTSEDEVNVVVEDYPIPDFSFQITSPEAHFTNLSNLQSNMQWDFGDGNFSSDVNPSHEYVGQGVYPVTLSLTNSCGTFSKMKEIGIFPQSNGNIVPLEEMVIFPTVTSDFLNIKFGGNFTQEIEYIIFDATGKLVIQNTLGNGSRDTVYSLDVSRLATGTYFFRVSDSKTSSFVKPFVKQ